MDAFWDLRKCRTFRDLKVSQDLLDSKATQALRSALNTSSNIPFSSYILCSDEHPPHSICRDFLALKEQLDFREIR